MADEPRRSGRATKGQHTKNSEEPPDAVKKRAGKGGRGKAAKKAAEQEEAQDQEEDAIIRCICGYVVEDKNDKRAMICCDKCLAWQHNVCMGLSEDDDELPETYFCEQCKPKDHGQTLTALSRGESIWETRQAEAQREEEGKRSRKRKGGRKSKGARASEIGPAEKKEVSTPVVPQAQPVQAIQAPSTPAPAPAPAPVKPKPETSNKRKVPTELPLDKTQANESVTSNKVRKVSTPKEPKAAARRQSSIAGQPARRDSKEVPLQAELVESIDELHSSTRQRAAKALVKLFVDSTQQAMKDGTFNLPTGQNVDGFGLRFGLTVEYSLYMNFWGHGETPNPPYGEKLRTIMHNVKDNSSLRDKLLNGTITPHDLTNMSSLEMARKELQEETAQIMKENEKQHVLIHEEGPRIRRTHKGDELIVDESKHMTSNDEPTSNVPLRRASSDAAETASPDQMSPRSPSAIELPDDVGRSPATSRPLTVDTKARPKPPVQRRKSTSMNFNMENVWSSVDSPSMNRPVPIPNTPASVAPGPGAKADPEIDHLLKDDEDEEPYSPMDYEMEPGTIWRGNVVMPLVAHFRGSARHVAGADLHEVFPWSQLMPPVLTIEGRIPVERASEYLCGLRWSRTTDVSVVSVVPSEHEADREQFDKLFTYFTSRARYGVVGKNPVSSVRDVYVVPLEAGAAKRPDFIELLQESAVEDVRPARSLLITYVIKTSADNAPAPGSGASAASATPRQPDFGSPLQASGHFRTPSTSSAARQSQPPPVAAAGQPHVSPPNPQPAFPSPAPQQQQQSLPHPTQESQHSFQAQAQQTSPMPMPMQGVQQTGTTTTAGDNTSSKTGLEAARLVLGPELASASTVQQLLATAPETGEAQWRVIREVLEEDPSTRADWGAFMGGCRGRLGAVAVGAYEGERMGARSEGG